MSRDAALIDRLMQRVEATGNRRARRWARALARDKRNPATARKDGRLGLQGGDAIDTLLTRPWMQWPTPDSLRRRK